MSFVILRRKVFLSSVRYMSVFKLVIERNVMFMYNLQLICLGYFTGDNFGEPVEQSFAQQ
jgi:hypothetical protein